MKSYTSEFYSAVSNSAAASAEVVYSAVAEILDFDSVVDVGCGQGEWLRAFVSPITDGSYLGIDSLHVDPQHLRIPQDHFHVHDLTQPLVVGRRFDLALCLEVAEHLPSTAAATLVQTLVTLSDQVVFSAAIPYQGGEGHLNEQWPDYWSSLFQERGYETIDVVRDQIWNDEAVAWWYAQNVLIFINQDLLMSLPGLEARTVRPQQIRRMVHYRRYWALTGARPLFRLGYRLRETFKPLLPIGRRERFTRLLRK